MILTPQIKKLLYHGRILNQPDGDIDIIKLKAQEPYLWELSLEEDDYYSELISIFPKIGITPDKQFKTGQTPLTVAIQNHHSKAIKQLLGIGANIYLEDHEGPPLYHAAIEKEIEVIALLIQHNPQIDLKDEAHYFAVYQILELNHQDLTPQILKCCIDLDVRNPYGVTLLMDAIVHGNDQLVDQLLQAGADPNQSDFQKITPLMFAALNNDLPLLRKLLKLNVSINARNHEGYTALMFAVLEESLDVIQLLLDSGADPNLRTMRGDNIRSLVQHSQNNVLKEIISESECSNLLTPREILIAVTENQLQTVKRGVEEGLNINYRIDSDLNLLKVATIEGYYDIIHYLLQHDANPDIEDRKGFTPLLYAVQKGELKIVQLLIKYGANLNHQNKNGLSALMLAFKCKHPQIISLLLRQDINLHLYDHQHNHTFWYALNYLESYPDDQIMKLFLDTSIILKKEKKSDNFHPLLYAVYHDLPEVVHYLIEQGVDLNERNFEKQSALMIAIKRDYPDIVKILLKAKPDLNITDYEGKSALSYAVRRQNLPLVKRLIQSGADPNNNGVSGQTPLIISIRNCSSTFTYFLLDSGADPNLPDENGVPPLIYALADKNEELVKRLISLNADIEVTDIKGRTPLMYTVLWKNYDLTLTLLHAGANKLHRNRAGECAKDLARKHQDYCMELILEDHTILPDLTPESLLLAVKNNQVIIVKYLTERGIDLNFQDQQGYTPMTYALINNNLDLTCYLLTQNVDLNIQDKDGLTPLMHAFKKGAGEIVDIILQKPGINYHLSDQNGETTLHYTINYIIQNKSPDYHLIQKIIDAKVDLSLTNQQGEAVFHLVLKSEDMAFILPFLPLAVEQRLWIADSSPLLTNLQKKHPEFVELLIDLLYESEDELPNEDQDPDSDIQLHSNNEISPLLEAVVNGQVEIVQNLIKKGVDVNIKNGSQETALMLSARYHTYDNRVHLGVYNNKALSSSTKDEIAAPMLSFINNFNQESYIPAQNDLTIANLLIDAGADLNVRNIQRNTALMIAIKKGNQKMIDLLYPRYSSEKREQHLLISAIKSGDLEAVKGLISSGTPVNFRNQEGISPFIVASLLDCDEIAAYLLEAGAQIDRNREIDCWASGKTLFGSAFILREASKKEYPGVVQLLLKTDVDINSTDEHQRTPLMFATIASIYNIMDYLIDAGADINRCDHHNQTALMLATRPPYFYSHKIPNPALKILLEAGADPNIKDIHGYTALYYTVANDRSGSCELLIDSGADLTTLYNHKTILMVAIENRSPQSIPLLIKKGVPINHQDQFGQTALIYFAREKENEVTHLLAQVLISSGSELDLIDDRGQSALFYAVIKGNISIATLLVQSGAKREFKNVEGLTPLMIAREMRDQKMIDLLQNSR